MNWKEQIEKISDQLDAVVKSLRLLQGQAVLNSRAIEALRVLVEQAEKTRSRAADRMADRLIEMALVNRGNAVEAASHRRSLNEEPLEGTDPWQDSPETQWPPPGCSALEIP